MKDVDVVPKIRALCEEKGISYYALSKRANIPYSTLSNMLNRPKNVPTVYSLERICRGLNITMAEFFTDEPSEHQLTEREISLLERWNKLNVSEQERTEAYIQALLDAKDG